MASFGELVIDGRVWSWGLVGRTSRIVLMLGCSVCTRVYRLTGYQETHRYYAYHSPTHTKTPPPTTNTSPNSTAKYNFCPHQPTQSISQK